MYGLYVKEENHDFKLAPAEVHNACRSMGFCKIWWTDRNEILHTSRQCNCRDVCKISLWCMEYILNQSNANCGRIRSKYRYWDGCPVSIKPQLGDTSIMEPVYTTKLRFTTDLSYLFLIWRTVFILEWALVSYSDTHSPLSHSHCWFSPPWCSHKIKSAPVSVLPALMSRHLSVSTSRRHPPSIFQRDTLGPKGFSTILFPSSVKI